jgi:hypothetical protein
VPIEQSRDPKQFAAFERSGWDSNIGGYDTAFGAVTRQTVRSMLDAAGVAPGMQVLDVMFWSRHACGGRVATRCGGNGARLLR